MPRRSAWRICLPNLAAVGATSQGISRARSAVATASASPRLSSSAHRHQDRAGHRPVRPHPGAREQGHHDAAHAQGDAHARVGGTAVGRQRVVAPAGADRAEGLVAVQAGLEDGARVVVQAAGDRQVGLDADAVVDQVRAGGDQRGELVEPLVEQRVLARRARGPARRRWCRRSGSWRAPAPGRRRRCRARPRRPAARAPRSAGSLSSLSTRRITSSVSPSPRPA